MSENEYAPLNQYFSSIYLAFLYFNLKAETNYVFLIWS